MPIHCFSSEPFASESDDAQDEKQDKLLYWNYLNIDWTFRLLQITGQENN